MESLRPPKGATHDRKVRGRGSGSGRGKTSGKGHKGQRSRAGGGVRPGFEGGQMPLYRRIARRGFSNYPFKVKYTVVNLGDLDAKFDSGATVSLASLAENKLIKSKVRHVKILGGGELSKKLAVDASVQVSSSARERIVAAGGTVAAGAEQKGTDAESTGAASTSEGSTQGE